MKQSLQIIIALIGIQCLAQNQTPEYGHLFLQDELARIDITLPGDSLVYMYDNVDYAAEHEFEATFIYSTSTTTDTIPQVGFRFRGNTSLMAAKKSFKVSFNTFTNGGQYHGVEKMNLNGEHNDVSLSRSKISWEMLRDLGIPSSRTSYVQVYVNGIYAGLYLNVEHIDEEFIKKRYGQKLGNLYKCLWPATLDYWGSDPDNYKAMAGNRRIYDLKTNRYRDDYSRLAQFIDVLNNTPDPDFKCEIEKVFNVDDYLKIAAFDILIGNWDGYIYNKNNYYLYENPQSGRLEYIPYDLDNTWGIDWLGQDWTQQGIYSWNAEDRPLYDRLMGVPEYREQFSFYMDQLLNEYFTDSNISSRLSAIQTLISDAISTDEFYTYDYGFNYQDFLDSDDQAWGEHVQYGILPYLTERAQTASAALESYGPLHVIKELRDSLMDFDTHLIRAWVEGEVDALSLYVDQGNVLSSVEMYDDGAHLDGDAGDGQYAAILSESDWGDYADFFVESSLGPDVEREPCGTRRVWLSQAEGPVYINEIMPSNSFVISDEAGEFDDWIELYNPGPSAVYLGGYYLTDDIHCPNKWQLPGESMTNNAFRLIWADKDEEQGAYHANFKMNSDGEELALFGIQNGALRLIDYIEFPAIVSDYSWGRFDDAGSPWVIFSVSTPEASNSTGILNVLEFDDEQMIVYPNPSSGWIRISGIVPQYIQLFGMSGIEVSNSMAMRGDILDCSGLAPGIYQLIVVDDQKVTHTRRVVIMD